MSLITVAADDGSRVEFDDTLLAGSGGMKDVYFARDKSYVVAWFRKPQLPASVDRLKQIAGVYRERIFHQPGGDYWSDLFCWPTKVVQEQGYTGVVVPTYHRNFFFEFGSKNEDSLLGIRGKEKQGRWFASATHQQKHLDVRERGDWLKYIAVCIRIARATRRLHAAGLAHSDLSYKNVLVDPRTGTACLIDLDGLVVPGKFPPDVLGTPDFIAPEVMKTLRLPAGDPLRSLPRRETDQHALAVLIYMYLLYRHPLRGGRIHDTSDPDRDESLTMGERALFIEHPTDRSNRPNLREVKPIELPYANVDRLPFNLVGPLLEGLFLRAFVNGLHEPHLRPTADEWESALVKTADHVTRCENASCVHGWFIHPLATPPSLGTVGVPDSPACPFCHTASTRPVPILEFFSYSHDGTLFDESHRLVVHHLQSLYPWHVSRKVIPNERLPAEAKRPVGYFVFHEGEWLLVNQTLATLQNVTTGENIPPGAPVTLRDGEKILLSPEEGGRLLQVRIPRV
jgi:serine/threonine protein kinase